MFYACLHHEGDRAVGGEVGVPVTDKGSDVQVFLAVVVDRGARLHAHVRAHPRDIIFKVALGADEGDENALRSFVYVEGGVPVPTPLLVAALAMVYQTRRAAGTCQVHVHDL